jgi:ferritin-like metal-binding protein YciE
VGLKERKDNPRAAARRKAARLARIGRSGNGRLRSKKRENNAATRRLSRQASASPLFPACGDDYPTQFPLNIRIFIMGLFTTKELNSLDELFRCELQDLYDAEHRLTEALPKLAEKASDTQLKRAFQNHLRETEKQIERLESIFERLGVEAKREKCDAIVGIIKEGEKVLDATGESHVIDAALIAAAQRAEHYEIAGYGTARSFAKQLGNAYAAELLEQTLEEEKGADEKLTSIALSSVNPASV